MIPPTIPGALNSDSRTVRVLCPHCGSTHTHGGAGIINGANRHRLAHCAGEGARKATGYFVEVPPGDAPTAGRP